jgi:DNA-binding response OmpR family regulator
MDLAMPNGDGKYIIECLRRNRDTAGTPVIILTGMRDPALQGQLLAAGADMFLRKPIAFDDLVHNIGRYIVLKPRSEIIESSE